MLIGFIGCPNSGKTTTAAMTFADLKNMGVNSEWIPEQARLYIAERRLINRQPPGSNVELGDLDQVRIYKKQIRAEDVMLRSSGAGTVIVTDTSVLCTWLYMDELSRSLASQELAQHALNYDLLFYCAPVRMQGPLDPNRVHGEEQALRIDSEIPKLLERFHIKPIPLLGDSQQRHHVVTRTILERMAR